MRKSPLSALVIFLFLIVSGGVFYWYGTGIGFDGYQKTNALNRMEPRMIPTQKMIHVTSMGHDLMYADLLWISLIQYIGDNLQNDAYLRFSDRILETITEVNPYFAPGYEWTLLLHPIPQNSFLTYTPEQKEAIQHPITIAKKGMDILCDQKKLETIATTPISMELWNNTNLRNPCKNGMLPYYIGFYGGQLTGNQSHAQQYYTIAGMQDDAPAITQVLAVLSSAPEKDPRTIATRFALLALGGIDTPPYTCHEMADSILSHINTGTLTDEWIAEMEEKEHNLSSPATDNPTSSGMNSCHEMLSRSLQYTYLLYITQKAKNHPEFTTGKELIDHNILTHIPTIRAQSGMTVSFSQDTWNYISSP